MTTLTITIDDRKAAALKDKAEHYGLPLEELLVASMENLLTQPEPDFERAMKHVLTKNNELYRRLG
ncbi:MAG: DNA-binding protein [bacterium]|nr:DNA-binding protein [bacterium]